MKRTLAFALCLVTAICSLTLTASAYSTVLIKEPDRTSFYEGKDWVFDNGQVVPLADFDASGAVVEVDGKEVQYRTHSWGGNMWITPKNGSTWSVGVNKALLYLDDYDDEVYVELNIKLVTISKTETVSPPDSSTLVMGVNWHYDRYGFITLDSLDLTGSKIKVYYSDSTSEIIEHTKSKPLQWQVPYETDDFVLGENTLQFNYEGHISTFTVNFVEELITGVIIKSQPKKTVYAFRNDWNYDSNGKIKPNINFSGMSVSVNYLGAGSKTVTYESCPEKFTYNESRTFKSGTTRLEVTYDGKYTFGYVLTIEAYGDLDLNGSIDSQDALLILQCVTARKQFEDNQEKYADVDLSGKVNSSDALYVLQHATGYIQKFKAEL